MAFERTAAVVAALSIAATGLFVSGGSAEAAESPVDITSVQAADVHVRSDSCHSDFWTVTYSAPEFYKLDYDEIEIWKGGDQVDTAYMVRSFDGPMLHDTYDYCPNRGLGRFRAGPNYGSWTFDDGSSLETGDVEDNTTDYFLAKSDQIASLSSSKKRGRVHLSTRVRHYVICEGWKAWARRAVYVQKKTSAGDWKTIRTLRTNSKGRASVSFTSSRKHAYRAVVHGNSRHWPDTSRTTSR